MDMKKWIAVALAAGLLLGVLGGVAVVKLTSKPAPAEEPTVATTAAPTTEATTAPATEATTEATTAPTTAPTTEATTAPTTAPTEPKNPPLITKNPTSESVIEGDNAYFVARAEDYFYIDWFIVSPDHRYQYAVTEAPRYFKGLSYAGENSTQLILRNCPLSLNGWCVEAMFTGEGGRSVTDHCYVYVKEAAKAPLVASPSSGYYRFQELGVQLTSAPGEQIHYEIHTPNGTLEGNVNSTDMVYVPAIDGICYDAYLYAFVINDSSRTISCKYTMDCQPDPQPEPQPEPDYGLDGAYRDDKDNIIRLTSDGRGNVDCNISIARLSEFNGYGTYTNGVAILHLDSPNGSHIKVSFDGHVLKVLESEWDLLPVGTEFDNFQMAVM